MKTITNQDAEILSRAYKFLVKAIDAKNTRERNAMQQLGKVVRKLNNNNN